MAGPVSAAGIICCFGLIDFIFGIAVLAVFKAKEFVNHGRVAFREKTCDSGLYMSGTVQRHFGDDGIAIT